MSAIRILLGIFCLAAIVSGSEPCRRVLNSELELTGSRWPGMLPEHRHLDDPQQTVRNTLMTIARSQIGVKEATGNNDGPQVEAYLKVTKLPKGNPWCAAFISWVFKQGGFAAPLTAWSPALFPLAKQTRFPKTADVLGIYSLEHGRIVHCGLVERKYDNWIVSVEGNTNEQGSRDGNGVYRKWRHRRTIALFADWVSPLKGGNHEN